MQVTAYYGFDCTEVLCKFAGACCAVQSQRISNGKYLYHVYFEKGYKCIWDCFVLTVLGPGCGRPSECERVVGPCLVLMLCALCVNTWSFVCSMSRISSWIQCEPDYITVVHSLLDIDLCYVLWVRQAGQSSWTMSVSGQSSSRPVTRNCCTKGGQSHGVNSEIILLMHQLEIFCILLNMLISPNL